ncbi:MAG: hypothetical protein L6Q99_09665 [Planctomycetes bacterium]|nr:hypothetical protein [Planctomycetota bacterium]
MGFNRWLATLGWVLLVGALFLGSGRTRDAETLRDAQVMAGVLPAAVALFAFGFRAEARLFLGYPELLAPFGWYLGVCVGWLLAVGAPLGVAGLGLDALSTEFGGAPGPAGAEPTSAVLGGLLSAGFLLVVGWLAATVLFEAWCAELVVGVIGGRPPDLEASLRAACIKSWRVVGVEALARIPGVVLLALAVPLARRLLPNPPSPLMLLVTVGLLVLPFVVAWSICSSNWLVAVVGAPRGLPLLAATQDGLRVVRRTWWRVAAHALIVGALVVTASERAPEPTGTPQRVETALFRSSGLSTSVSISSPIAGERTRERRWALDTSFTGGVPTSSRWLARDDGEGLGLGSMPTAVVSVVVFALSLALRLFVARAVAEHRRPEP